MEGSNEAVLKRERNVDAVFEFVKREKRVVFIREMFNGNDLTSKEELVEYFRPD